MNKKMITRRAVCAGATTAAGIYLLGGLLERTTLIPGLSLANEKAAQTTRRNYVRAQTYEGLFVDRFGTCIQTPAQKAGEAAKLVDPLAYRLIGYRSGSLGYSGLRAQLYDIMFNPHGETAGGENCGGNVRLTLDDELQRGCYEAVCRGQYGASAIIMDADTGELLCCTSSQFGSVEYDVNEYYNNKTLYDAQNTARTAMDDDPAFTCVTPPGSTSKLITAAAMLRNGAPLEYTDKTGTYNGISNFKHAIVGTIGLSQALEKSSNVYFAAGADAVGREALLKELEAFGYNSVIPLDNGATLKPRARAEDDAEARQLAIGQGKIDGAPLFNCMIYGALCSGNVVRPHLIRYAFSNEGDVLLKGEETTILASPLADDVIRMQLRNALQGNARKYGLQRDGGWTVMAKTGTAEVAGLNNSIHLCAAVESPRGHHYAIALNRQNTTDTSNALLAPMKDVLDLLSARSALLESEG